MWESERLLSLFLTAFAVAMTPGPNNLILTSVGASIGFVRGLRAAGGVILGFPLMVFLVALGMGKLIAEVEWIVWLLRGLGLVVLLWIAWKIASMPILGEREGEERSYGFCEMFVFQWVNPKAWAVTTTFASVYLTGEGEVLGGSVWWDAGTLGSIFFTTAVISGLSWLAVGSVIGRVLRHKVWARVYGVSMSILLLASVLSVMWRGVVGG